MVISILWPFSHCHPSTTTILPDLFSDNETTTNQDGLIILDTPDEDLPELRSEDDKVIVVPFDNQETLLECSDSELIQVVDGVDFRIQSPGFPEKPAVNSR